MIESYEMFFNLTVNEIFVTDKQGKCILVNPACEKNLGIESKNLIGMNVKELEDKREFFPSSTLRAIEHQSTIVTIQSDNKGRKLHATSTPIFDDDGTLLYVISNTVDVSDILDLKEKVSKMESVIKRYNREIVKLKNKDNIFKDDNLFSSSSSIKKILVDLEKASKFDIIILLLGETGVGKTEIARWVHSKSSRNKNEFVELNCSTIPDNLIESELFGYVGGAFTGADKKGKEGLLYHANKGTLLFDEIGELSLEAQAKLLQFIQDKTFRKIGSNKSQYADVRILAATNRNLRDMIIKGTFREDLYYRLSIFPVRVPSLRERKDDIEDLAVHILNKINNQHNTNKILSTQTMDQIVDYDWPGNIRQLKNLIERLVVTTDDVVIEHDLENNLNLANNTIEEKYETDTNEPINKTFDYFNDDTLSLFKDTLSPDSKMSFQERIEFFERTLLSTLVKDYKTTYQLANYLNTSQSTMSRKLNKYNIDI